MNKVKVIKVDSCHIEFDNGLQLSSECSESRSGLVNHFLSFSALSLDDFIDLEFDLSGDKFFKKIKGYGIELIPIKGQSVKIKGYGYNPNGHYIPDLSLLLTDIIGGGFMKQFRKEFDISECQILT
jgi:hypothetical protein